MRNVTITLPDDLAKWAKVEAAKADMSLSAWIGRSLTLLRRGGAGHGGPAPHLGTSDDKIRAGPAGAENRVAAPDALDRAAADRRRRQRAALDDILNLDGVPFRSVEGPPKRHEIYDDIFHRHDALDLSGGRARTRENDDRPQAPEKDFEF